MRSSWVGGPLPPAASDEAGARQGASAVCEVVMFERASVRVNPRTPVRVEIGRAGHPIALGVVANISDQGACVVTDGQFPIGEALVLHLVFSPESQPFQAAGRVVWARTGGDLPGAQRYGLQWAHRTGPQHARLREMITEEL